MTDNDILYCTHDSAFQVNNLLQVAQKYQAAASESGPAGVSNNDAQTICNMLVNYTFSSVISIMQRSFAMINRKSCISEQSYFLLC